MASFCKKANTNSRKSKVFLKRGGGGRDTLSSSAGVEGRGRMVKENAPFLVG